MSNSAEAQDILLDMLEQAKKETGFDPEDYNLKVEALVMADTNFIFTITKLPPEEKSKISKRKFNDAIQPARRFNIQKGNQGLLVSRV